MQIAQKVVYQQLTKNFAKKPDDDSSSNQPVDQFNQPVFNTPACIYDPSNQLPAPTNESALLGLSLNDDELNPSRLLQVQSASLGFNNPPNNNNNTFYIQPQTQQQQQQQQAQYRFQPQPQQQQHFHFDANNNNYHGQFAPPINDYYNSYAFTPSSYKLSSQGSYLCKPMEAPADFGSQFQISFSQQPYAAAAAAANNNNNASCFLPASHCFDPSDFEPKHSQSASLNPQCDTPPPIITKSSSSNNNNNNSSSSADLLCYSQAKADDCIEIIAKTGQELSEFNASAFSSNKSAGSSSLYSQASMDPMHSIGALNVAESSDVASAGSAYYASIDATPYAQQCYAGSQSELKQQQQPAFYQPTQDYFGSQSQHQQQQKQTMDAELHECAQVNYYHDLGSQQQLQQQQQQSQGTNIFNSLMSMLSSSSGTNQADMVYPMCQTQQQQLNSRIKNPGFGLARNLGVSKNSAFQQYMPSSSSNNGHFNNQASAGFARSGAVVNKVKPQMSELQQDLRFTDSRAKEWCMNSHPRLSTTLLSYSGADLSYGFGNGSDNGNGNGRKSKLCQSGEAASFQSFQPRHILNKADLQANEIVLNDAHV
jgi:hypothetical protein